MNVDRITRKCSKFNSQFSLSASICLMDFLQNDFHPTVDSFLIPLRFLVACSLLTVSNVKANPFCKPRNPANILLQTWNIIITFVSWCEALDSGVDQAMAILPHTRIYFPKAQNSITGITLYSTLARYSIRCLKPVLFRMEQIERWFFGDNRTIATTIGNDNHNRCGEALCKWHWWNCFIIYFVTWSQIRIRKSYHPLRSLFRVKSSPK